MWHCLNSSAGSIHHKASPDIAICVNIFQVGKQVKLLPTALNPYFHSY